MAPTRHGTLATTIRGHLAVSQAGGDISAKGARSVTIHHTAPFVMAQPNVRCPESILNGTGVSDKTRGMALEPPKTVTTLEPIIIAYS